MPADPTKKLALHAAAYPDLSLDNLIERALRLGYQGLHLQLLPTPGRESASDVTQADPAQVRSAIDKAKLTLVCLDTGIALHYSKAQPAAEAQRLASKAVRLAAEMGAQSLALQPGLVLFGKRPTPVLLRIAERARRIADRAEAAGVRLLYENTGSFTRAKPMWDLVEATDHENIGVSWNAAYAALEKELPAVSLNVLNHRIHLLKLQDGDIEEAALRQTQIGTGSLNVERLLQIAAGIGYAGFLSVVWDRLAEPNLTDSDEALAAAAKTIHEWMRPKLDKKGNPLTNREAKYLEFDPEEEKRKAAEKAAKAAKAKAEAAAEK